MRSYLKSFTLLTSILLAAGGLLSAQDRIGSAVVFGPVDLPAGKNLKMCTNNLADGSVRFAWRIFDATDSRNPIAVRSATLASGAGACVTFSHDPRAVGSAGGENGIIAILIGVRNNNQFHAAVTDLQSSVQVTDGISNTLVPPANRINILIEDLPQ